MNRTALKEGVYLFRITRRIVLTCLLGTLVLCAVYSCGKESSTLDKAKEYFDRGKYRDALFVIKHHFRRGGVKTPELLFLEGVSYLRLGMETQAVESFYECYRKDTAWAEKLAETLRDEAMEEFGSGNHHKARRMVEQAVNFMPGVDFGRYDAIAGELFLDKKIDTLAAEYFERFIRNYPDTSGISKVMLNLATAYAGIGDTARAIEVCREIINKYPKSSIRSRLCF